LSPWVDFYIHRALTLSSALLCFAVAERGSEVAAQESPAHREPVVALLSEGTSLERITLVGPSAELYRAAGENRWVRRSAGGVAVDVLAAFPAPGGRVFAIGNRSPIFERIDGVWYARPLPNHGRTTAARGGVPMVAVSRYIYMLQGSSWRRAATASGRVSAIFCADRRHYWAATENGQILRGAGRGLVAVRSPLAGGDFLQDIFGAAQEVLAVSAKGAMVTLRHSGATLQSLPSDLSDFVPQAGAPGPASSLLLAGTTASGEGVLVKISRGVATRVDSLWSPAPGDRFSVLFRAADNSLLVGTRAGDVRVRKSDGTFTTVELSGVPNDEDEHSDPGAAPAQAR
jgi:hypothetical protein